MTALPTEPHPADRRSLVGRIFGYPLVTILVGFALFVVVLGAIVWGNLTRLLVVVLGGPALTPEDKGVPGNAASIPAWGYATLIASLIVVPIAVLLYRWVIVRGCEGRATMPELAWTQAARRWVGAGCLLSVVVIAVTLLSIAVLGGSVQSAAGQYVLPGVAYSLGMALFAGVVEELFARGTLFRVSEQHVGSLIALAVTVLVFGLQHADNPNASAVSTAAVALEGGLMLAAVYMLARTLWAVVAVHVVWNLGQSLLSIPVSGNQTLGAVDVHLTGPDWLTGGQFGLEPSTAALVLWGLVTVVALGLAWRQGRWWGWSQARRAVADRTANEPVLLPA